MGRKLYLCVYYPSVCLCVSFIFERWPSSSQLKRQNSQTPNIHFKIMCFPEYNFRRQIIQSATDSVSPPLRMYCPSKICNFDPSIGEQQILRLKITMDDRFRVQQCQSFDNLSQYNRYLLLWKEFLSLEVGVQFTLGSVLQDKVEIRGIGKVAEQFEDIQAVKGGLNYDLSFYLFEEVPIFYFLPSNTLECYHKL